MKDTLAYKLNQLAKSDIYPFHMPGHKRNLAQGRWGHICPIDITEIDGFDNLHHAQGILAKEQERASEIYGSKHSFFLINGSSCGVLSAICASVEENGQMILARNSHKSAYHAIDLQRLKVSFVYPQMASDMLPCGGVKADDIGQMMDETGAKVVFITSPTYEGVISDISAISNEVHARDGILIVDEAHGAHLAFHKAFGASAVNKGADLVIQSLHKTMPAMTQTALLHVCSDRVNTQEIKRYLSIFQTSSPSYVLMASISDCLSMIEQQKDTLFDSYVDKLTDFYTKAKGLQNLRVLDGEWALQTYQLSKDPSKIVIFTENLVDENKRAFHGPQLYALLRDHYHLQMEMQMGDYVLAMTSVLDTQDGFDRLWSALFEIDQLLQKKCLVINKDIYRTEIRPKQITDIHHAIHRTYEVVPLPQAIGYVSCEYMYLYPPGTPILVPGELISQEIWNEINRLKNLGLTIQGTEDMSSLTVKAYKDFRCI